MFATLIINYNNAKVCTSYFYEFEQAVEYAERTPTVVEIQDIDTNETVWVRPLEGYEVRHDYLGYYICTHAEAVYEDEGHNSVGFDGRPHFETHTEAWVNFTKTKVEND